jgi:hypothetical protein
VCEKAVSEQNAQRISPTSVCGRLRTTPFRFIHHIVMHQRSDVDEFDDDGQIDMSGIDCACGAPREQSQQRPKTFPTAADRVNDVPFDCGIECRSLLPDARLDLFEMRLN